MELNRENQTWLRLVAKEMEVEEEILLNQILLGIRGECGKIEGGLEEWFKKGEAFREEVRRELEESRRLRVMVEESARANRMYLGQCRGLKETGTTP